MPNYLRLIEEAGSLVEKVAPEAVSKLTHEASVLLSETKIGRAVEKVARAEFGETISPRRPIDVEDVWQQKLEARLASQFEPRRFGSNPALFERGGSMRFFTSDKVQVNLAVPSNKDLESASGAVLKKVFDANQRELLGAVERLNRGDFPPLGFHGTSTKGEAGLWTTKMAKRPNMGSIGDGDFWLWTNRHESLHPREYLSETQRALEKASDYSGKTEERGAIFVTDASQQFWRFKGEAAGIQRVSRDESQVGPHESIDDFIGKSTDNLRKTQLHEPLLPDTFDSNVLGSFQTNRRLPLENQFQPLFTQHAIEKRLYAHAFDLQISTAETFDLAGLLKKID
ncbi:MAG: hypothetical protein P4L53_24430 [Candidatus Obscuribacterales bacterium]|nr:hypothetical protein [Candidatus Obscuribacterales bacterium]